MLDLAFHSSEGPVHLGDVARRQGIGVMYLEQIALRLRKADYWISVREPRGGRLLSRPRREISVAEVVTVLEGGAETDKFHQECRGVRALGALRHQDNLRGGHRSCSSKASGDQL